MVVLKRLGRVAEAKKLDSKNLSETKTLETLKTGCMSQLCKQGSRQKNRKDSEVREKGLGDPVDNKFSAEDPQTGHKLDAPEKSWTNEKSWKGEETLLPVSAPSALCTKLTSNVAERQGGVHFASQERQGGVHFASQERQGGVHFSSQNKVFAASGLKEPKTDPLKDQSLW